MKKIMASALLSFSAMAFAQNTGVGTTNPRVTLDVAGTPAAATAPDGLRAPQITRDQLSKKTAYAAAQAGAIVYITDASGGTNTATADIAATGYYYFDGAKWVALKSGTAAGTTSAAWNNTDTNSQATGVQQNIYQLGNVSIGRNSGSFRFNIFDDTKGNDLRMFHLQNTLADGGTQFFDFMGNLKAGDYTYLSNQGDQALIFDVGNDGGPPYLNRGLIISPHVNGGKAVPYGMKITMQGLSGFNAINPTETLDIAGSFRVRTLPLNGTDNAIYTDASGNNYLGASATGPAGNNNAPLPGKPFVAKNTVVANEFGVLGIVAGLPQTAAPAYKPEFYAPAIALPTSAANVSTNTADDISYANGTYTVRLYSIFQKQFGMTGDVAGSTRTALRSNASSNLTTYSATALDYFITYFDNTVFDPNAIAVDANGVLTYKVLSAAAPTDKTYMNIVFKVK